MLNYRKFEFANNDKVLNPKIIIINIISNLIKELKKITFFSQILVS